MLFIQCFELRHDGQDLLNHAILLFVLQEEEEALIETVLGER
jgi:hypothetical protein